jgi:hypothetical protein
MEKDDFNISEQNSECVEEHINRRIAEFNLRENQGLKEVLQERLNCIKEIKSQLDIEEEETKDKLSNLSHTLHNTQKLYRLIHSSDNEWKLIRLE